MKHVRFIFLYNIFSTFGFGQYKGKKIKEIIKTDLPYIKWCLLNVHSFALDDDVVDFIKTINPEFLNIENLTDVIKEKYNDWYLEEEEASRRYQDDQISANNKQSGGWGNSSYNDSLDTDQQSPEWWDSL